MKMSQDELSEKLSGIRNIASDDRHLTLLCTSPYLSAIQNSST